MSKSFVHGLQAKEQGSKPSRIRTARRSHRRSESVRRQRRLRLPGLHPRKRPGWVLKLLLRHLRSRLRQRLPLFLRWERFRGAALRRAIVDPWRLSPSSRAEPFVLAGLYVIRLSRCGNGYSAQREGKVTVELDECYAYSGASRDWCFIIRCSDS